MAGIEPLILRAAVAVATMGVAAIPALAAGIMVLTNAEPGLSQAGRSIWTCTYVNGTQMLTIVRETPCPPSIPMP